MTELEDAAKFLEQFGGSDDPPYVSGSSVFGKGDRVTDQYGVHITERGQQLAPSDLGGVQSGGGRRRLSRNRKTRNRKTRNRKTRNRKTHRSGRRPRFTLNLRAQIRLKH
jgi:hypothetical protein